MLSELDLKILRKILLLGRQIESQAMPDQPLPAELMAELLHLAKTLATSLHPDVQRLGDLADSLHPEMGLERFFHFMVPVERLLDRSAKDSDFLVDELDRDSSKIERVPLVGVLDHLRSAFNVGSIFRVADGFGLSQLHLVGYTARPDTPAVAKTALGSGRTVDWSHWNHLSESIEALQSDNYEVVALETVQGSGSLFDFNFAERTALVLGNERFGINITDLKKCDRVVRIPLRGTKNSLNVVSAFAITCFEWSRQHR